MARSVHDHLTVANVNAGTIGGSPTPTAQGRCADPGRRGHQAPVGAGQLQPLRATRLVPRRTSTQSSGTAATPLVTAFRNEAAGTLVIVAVNPTTSISRQQFTLAGVRVDSITPWVTSETLDLVQQSAVSAGTGFTFNLPARV